MSIYSCWLHILHEIIFVMIDLSDMCNYTNRKQYVAAHFQNIKLKF